MKYCVALLFLCFNNAGKAQQINAIVNSLTDNTQKADTLMYFARRYIGMAKNDSANLLLKQAGPYALASDNNTIAKYYVSWSIYNQRIGNYRQSVDEGKKALPYFDGVTNLNVQSNCYYFLAKCYGHLRMYDSLQHFFLLNEQINNLHNPYRNWEIYAEKGRIFQQNKNLVLAEEYLLKAYDIAKTGKSKMDYVVTLTYLERLYLNSKKPDKYAKVISEIDKAMANSKMRNDNPTHAALFKGMDSMRIDERIDFLSGVKNELVKNKDTINAAFANSAISSLYEKQGMPAKALPYMQENMKFTKNQGNLSNHYIYTKAVFRLLTKEGRVNEALETSDYLFKLSDSITNKEQQGKLLEFESKYQNSLKQKEIEMLTAKNQLSLQQLSLLAAKFANDSLQLANETGQRKALFRENLLKEIAFDEQLKNNELLSRQNTLMDSIVKSEYAYSASVNKEKEKQAALSLALDRENKLKADQLRKERNTKWGLVTGVGLLFISGIFILVLYRKQINKNSIIQKQSADLEVLMKEIHHRVKNNLQVVSSLLDLQSHTITDSQASAAVKEGKNRVQSMALIHQNLYSEGNIKGIMVKEYISNLVQSLSDSYNISNDKVKINVDIDNLNLDVDTMIPLGLVLNELVSNSFKYAFNETRSGILNIRLQEKDEKLHLRVSDNGLGFPADVDVKSAKSFGLKMIRAFAQKLKATLDIYNNNGAVVEMQISKFKAA
ncbi:MAG: sensor histidine kinase [Chitinophagaceae bacterium]|nr:sensor histidine kinase [Chitinophagaceae bacterium]